MTIGAVQRNTIVASQDVDTSNGVASDESASLLPDAPAQVSGGDPAAMLAALFVKVGAEQKKDDNTLRASAEKAEDSAEATQVDQMREKAHQILAGALVSGGLSVMSATASFAQVGALSSGSGQGVGDAAKAAEKARDTSAKFWDATGKALDTGSKLASQVGSAVEANTDANVTAADHAGSHAKRAVDDAKTAADDAQKFVDQVLGFYRDYESASSQATQATLHRA